MRTYKKPVVTVDAGMAEGVYAASGASKGTLNVTYLGVWDSCLLYTLTLPTTPYV